MSELDWRGMSSRLIGCALLPAACQEQEEARVLSREGSWSSGECFLVYKCIIRSVLDRIQALGENRG